MLPCSCQCGLNIVIVPWQVGMQPPMEGTPMSLNSCTEDHFVTMVMHSTLFIFLFQQHTDSFRKVQLKVEWALLEKFVNVNLMKHSPTCYWSVTEFQSTNLFLEDQTIDPFDTI